MLLPSDPQLMLCHSRFTAFMLRTAGTTSRSGRKVQVFQVRKHRSRKKRVAAMRWGRHGFSSPGKPLPAPVMANDGWHIWPILRFRGKHPSQQGLKNFVHCLWHCEFPLSNVLKKLKMVSPSKGYSPVMKLYRVTPLDQTSILNPENCSLPLA